MSLKIPNIIKSARPHFRKPSSSQDSDDKLTSQSSYSNLKSEANAEKDSYNQISSPCSTRPSPSFVFNENEARSNSEESVSFEKFKLDERTVEFEDSCERKTSEETHLVVEIENVPKIEQNNELESGNDRVKSSLNENSYDQNCVKFEANEDFSFKPVVPHILDKNESAKSILATFSQIGSSTEDLHTTDILENEFNDSKINISRTPLEIITTFNNDLVKHNFADGIVDPNFDPTTHNCKNIKEKSQYPTKNEMDVFKTEKFRLSEDYVRLAKEFPYVAGVYFDRYQQRWSVNWNENGRRIAKYFPVKTYGFETAYKLAVKCREQQKFPEQALDLMNKLPSKQRAKFSMRERKRNLEKNDFMDSNSSTDLTAMNTSEDILENSDNFLNLSEGGSNLTTSKSSSKSFDGNVNQWRSDLHNTRKKQAKVYPKFYYEEKETTSNNLTSSQNLVEASENSNSVELHNMSLRKKPRKIHSEFDEDPKELETPPNGKSLEKNNSFTEETDNSSYLKPESDTHNKDKSSQLSAYAAYQAKRKRKASDQESFKFSKEIIKEALSLPRVPGVWFDKVQCRWACNFVERKRRRAKYFPVKDYGIHNGRKMAIETRLAFDKSNNSNDSSSESNNRIKIEKKQNQDPKNYFKSSKTKSGENKEETNAEDSQIPKYSMFSPFSLGVYTAATFEQLLLVQKLVILGILRNLRNICLYNLTSILTSASFQRYYMLLHSHVMFIEKATSFSEITPFLTAFIKCIEDNRMPGEFPIEKQIEIIRSIQNINLNNQNYHNYNGFSDNDSISNSNVLEDTSLYLVQGI